jgi:hypothetical protein
MTIGFDIKHKSKSELEIILNKHTTAPQLLKRLKAYNKDNHIYLEVRANSQDKKIILAGKQEEAAKPTGIYFIASVEKDKVVFSCNKNNDTKKYLAGFCLDY